MNKLILGVLSIVVAVACFDNPSTPGKTDSTESTVNSDTTEQETLSQHQFVDHTLLDDEYRFAFYNVENLFDTLDNLDKIDEEFTPQSEKAWNTTRYNQKLSNISSVVEGMGFPSILGLSEVENKAVLEDLIMQPSIKNNDYGIVHYESPDMRGIDVALLYKKSDFKLTKSDKIRVKFPDHIARGYTSRDILCVEGIFKGQATYFFVNHWPSRYGGVAKSEPKRKHVAQYLRKKVDEIQAKNPDASIVIMGDFNDETDNVSLTQVLKAKTDSKNINKLDLINCSAALDQKGKGSYYYSKSGAWNMLDQFIVSASTMNGASKIQTTDFQVYESKDVMFYHRASKMYRPSRTYGGPRYYGGYSDHLAVYIDVEISE